MAVGEARNKTGLEILDNDGNAQGKTDDRKQKRNEAEELQRAVVLEQRADHGDDFNAVADGIKFGLGAFRAIAVLNRHVFDAPTVVDGVDGKFSFDLESLGKHGEGLDERAAHGAISRHNVVETVAVDPA